LQETIVGEIVGSVESDAESVGTLEGENSEVGWVLDEGEID